MTMTQENLEKEVHAQAKRAKEAGKTLAVAATAQKNEALRNMGDALWVDRDEILHANLMDVEQARALGQSAARLDRLLLNESRIRDMMAGLRDVATLTDPIGEILQTHVRADGLRIEKVRVPLGVLAMIYESRPNVTVDAAALSIKTGNAVILRGGKEAVQSNRALVRALKAGLRKTGLPESSVELIERTERESVDVLIRARGLVDLAIPRGGAGLIDRVVQNAIVPVIETGVGNCHVYVDAHADLNKALPIVMNAKTSRPSVCNAMETLLIHKERAAEFLQALIPALLERKVQLRACVRIREIWCSLGQDEAQILPASEEDFATEFLDMVLAIKVVDSLDSAMRHIDQYGTKHSEAIVTEDLEAARTFLAVVDAAAVYHNASTRFTDGSEFGFGAEIGISTQKLHARGPMGLAEMTSYKYVIHGNGHIRG